ncbi:glycosyl hydrolase family 8 [Aliidiomarina indica]|uniref:glycosyl hydrolase family 8 n=1 Tax=Aliidiomarina indica TaxID=2749147 RepID=UPI00188FB4C2|nr:glycosyl hydrolase family 8 [Aliidiomarina indica]
MVLRKWKGLAAGFVLVLLGCEPATVPVVQDTPKELTFQWHYGNFVDHFIDQGRVIDFSDPRSISTSEGQAYGMWFALLADDPTTFSALLEWAEDNLARGQLGDQLPAWLWGQRENESWGVLDHNPAIDADIWMTFALYAAAERWQRPRYRALANRMSQLILSASTKQLEEYRVLLPAPFGFEHDDYLIVNPSYFSLTLFDGLAVYAQENAWRDITASSRHIFTALANEDSGAIPDWLAVDRSLAIVANEQLSAAHQESVSRGSYDAIRSYLWLHWDAEQQNVFDVRDRLQALVDYALAHGYPPENVYRDGRAPDGVGSIGFSAVLLPYFKGLDSAGEALARQQKDRILARDPERYRLRYYDTMLLMFGLSALQCVEFLPDGRLNVSDEVLHACR